MTSDPWNSYGLPVFGVAFGIGGLALFWIASRHER